MNELQAKQVAENQKLFDSFWRQYMSTDSRLAADGTGAGDPYDRKKAELEASMRLQAGFRAAFSVAVRPLPVNHHLVPAPVAQPRTDLVPMQEISRETICSVYQVPAHVLVGEVGRTATGATISSESFMQTVRMWRQRMSRVMTYIYAAVYAQADAAFMWQRGLIKPNTRFREAQFVLPDVVTADFPTLSQMYALKIIPWVQFQTTALRLHHMYPPNGIPADEPDPWMQEQRIEMVKQQSNKLGLNQTGIAATTVLGCVVTSVPRFLY